MTQTITAIYRNGVLYPTEALALQEHQQVKIQILADESEMERPPITALAREKQAFLDMHPVLLEQYPEQYVAIHNGQLIDHDADKLALYTRIEQRYPDQFVLMRRVESVPERELVFRSPRFVEKT